MQNRKWILTSLVMTFFGIPILAQFLAAVIAMLGVGLAGIIEVCNIFITPTIYLLLNIFMLALGALMLFFSGRVWADDSTTRKKKKRVGSKYSFFSRHNQQRGRVKWRRLRDIINFQRGGRVVGWFFSPLAGRFVSLISRW